MENVTVTFLNSHFLLSTLVTEIHYHQIVMKGHVCVAGKNTSLNMQMPATAESQRYVQVFVMLIYSSKNPTRILDHKYSPCFHGYSC